MRFRRKVGNNFVKYKMDKIKGQILALLASSEEFIGEIEEILKSLGIKNGYFFIKYCLLNMGRQVLLFYSLLHSTFLKFYFSTYCIDPLFIYFLYFFLFFLFNNHCYYSFILVYFIFYDYAVLIVIGDVFFNGSFVYCTLVLYLLVTCLRYDPFSIFLTLATPSLNLIILLNSFLKFLFETHLLKKGIFESTSTQSQRRDNVSETTLLRLELLPGGVVLVEN